MRRSSESPNSRRRWLTGAAWLAAATVAQGASASFTGSRLRGQSTDGTESGTDSTPPIESPPAVPDPPAPVRPKRPKTKLRGGSKPPVGGGGDGKALESSERLTVRVFRRLAYGHAPGDLERFAAGGVTLEEQLDSWLDEQLRAPFSVPGGEVTSSLHRRIATQAQLREVLTSFWLDLARRRGHSARRRGESLPGRDEAQTRAEAFGRFDALAPGMPTWRVARRLSRRLLGSRAPALEETAIRAARAAAGRADQTARVVRAIAQHPDFLAAPASAPRAPDTLVAATVRALGLDPMATLATPAVQAAVERLPRVESRRARRATTSHARLAAWTAIEQVVASADPADLSASIDDWSTRLLGRTASTDERRALERLLDVPGVSSIAAQRAAAVALLLSPTFQGR